MSCPSFKLNDTLAAGVLLVGTLVSYVLLGAVTLQVYVYYGRFPQDSIKMKAMVGAVWCGEVGHAISLGMVVYTNLITYFGHPEHLAHLPNSLLATILLGGLVSLSVQIFFAFQGYERLAHPPNSLLATILLGGSSFIQR
ncbi:hypothetical protein B0H14DRAFT_2646921 [Mycena olivaceomarginata]|nr:hypothetical protein B0H14DRAFT_2646921 [Mycena olivaceomarginata]